MSVGLVWGFWVVCWCRRLIWWWRAVGVRAERIQGTRSGGGGDWWGVGVGGCWRMTWALVPETPKEETAARRGGGGGPGLGGGGEVDAVSPWCVGGGCVDVQGGGYDAVVHGLHHFDDADDAGGGLAVADVGFDGAE